MVRAATAPQPTKMPLLLSSKTAALDREHELKALMSELEKNKDHAPVLVRIAQISRETGKLSESVRYLREAVDAEPKNREARLELGRALFETGDVEGAIRESEALLQIDPNNIDGLYNLGAIYGNLGQDQRAREYWEKAIAVGPDSDSGRRAKENLQKLR